MVPVIQRCGSCGFGRARACRRIRAGGASELAAYDGVGQRGVRKLYARGQGTAPKRGLTTRTGIGAAPAMAVRRLFRRVEVLQHVFDPAE